MEEELSITLKLQNSLKVGESIPAKILHWLPNLGNNKVLTSASIAFLNSLSFLSRIFLHLAYSSDIFLQKVVCHNKTNGSSKMMSH